MIFSQLTISAPDRLWIEKIRQRHDPQHRLVEPHVTFVFPFSGVSVEAVVAHARDIAAATAPISFCFSRAAAVKDPLGPKSHLFLLPTEGADQMRQLHARLYSGALAAHRHPTAAFHPHVTVGAFDTLQEAEDVAASLEAFDVAGTLSSLRVADFDGQAVVELQDLKFG